MSISSTVDSPSTVDSQRKKAWRWFAASLVPAVFFLYENWQFSKWAAERDSQGAFVCGTGLVGVSLMCAVLAYPCSLAAFVYGLRSYLRTAAPRPLVRLGEVFAVGGVITLSLCYVIFVVAYVALA